MTNFVLEGHICFSKNKDTIEEHKNSYLVCINNKSAGIFDTLPEKYKNLPHFDYGNRLILPGLIDLHIHAPQYAYRGLGMDMELLDWLNVQAFPEEAKYKNLNYAEAAYSIFADSMRRSATTRAVIFATLHKEATLYLMREMEKTGLISYIGKVNMDRNSPDILRETTKESICNTKKWINESQKQFTRTFPILTPRFIPSCSDELMKGLKKIQNKTHLPLQSHLSENPNEVEWVSKLVPSSKFYGDAYNIFGLFGKECKTVMAHCVYSSEEEQKLIKENGVFVAHCPASNSNLASGIAPIRKYLNQKINVGLGSDVAGGQTESIFRAMVDAIQVSKLYWRLMDNDCSPLSFDEVFYLATKGGGKYFGKVGSFEKGYEFDAIVIDDSDLPYPQKLTIRQRLERIVYLSSDIKGLHAKYVKGQKIML